MNNQNLRFQQMLSRIYHQGSKFEIIEENIKNYQETLKIIETIIFFNFLNF
jgi:hypothetical protein